MYNPELKQRYINQIGNQMTKESIENVISILNKGGNIESYFKKDIYEMNMNETRDLLSCYSNKSIASVRVTIAILKPYVNFCISEGLVPTRINWFDILEDKPEDFVDLQYHETRLLSNEQILEAVNKTIVNARDKAILWLLYVGIKGEEMCDLINLKVVDVKPNAVYLESRKEFFPIDEFTYKILQEAIEEENYAKNNGESTSVRKPETPLAITGYVIRPVGINKTGKITFGAIMNAIRMIKKILDNKNLNAINIWESGMLNMAKQIKSEKGELTTDDWKAINKKYGRGVDLWNVTKLKLKEFI